jgi:hypothetical protein
MSGRFSSATDIARAGTIQTANLVEARQPDFDTVPQDPPKKQVLILTQRRIGGDEIEKKLNRLELMVGAGRFERPTPCAQQEALLPKVPSFTPDF